MGTIEHNFELTNKKFAHIWNIVSQPEKASVPAFEKITGILSDYWLSADYSFSVAQKGRLLIYTLKISRIVYCFCEEVKNSTDDLDSLRIKVNLVINRIIDGLGLTILLEITEHFIRDRDNEALDIVNELFVEYMNIHEINITPTQKLKCLKTMMQVINDLHDDLDTSEISRLVSAICMRIQNLVVKIAKENDPMSQKDLKFYQLQLLELAKLFPHENFVDCGPVLVTLLDVIDFKMKLNGNLSWKSGNDVFGLLAVLQKIIFNKNILQSLNCMSHTSPESTICILSEVVNIIAKAPAVKVLNVYFDSKSNENLLCLIFNTALKVPDLFDNSRKCSLVLCSLTVCITLCTQSSECVKLLHSFLMATLISKNTSSAFLSLNCWIFIAQISSSELCIKYFHKFRQAYQCFSTFDKSPQKFYIGRALQVFFMGVRSKFKQKIHDDFPMMSNLNMWHMIKLDSLKSTEVQEELINNASNILLTFLQKRGGVSIRMYNEMVRVLLVCSTTSKQNLQLKLITHFSKLCTFLESTVINADAFLYFYVVVLRLAIACINNLKVKTVSRLLKAIDGHMSTNNEEQLYFALLDFMSKIPNHFQELTDSSAYQLLLSRVVAKLDIYKNVKSCDKPIIQEGFSISNENNHICRIECTIFDVSEPSQKRRKICQQPDMDKEKQVNVLIDSIEKSVTELKFLQPIKPNCDIEFKLNEIIMSLQSLT